VYYRYTLYSWQAQQTRLPLLVAAAAAVVVVGGSGVGGGGSEWSSCSYGGQRA